MVHPQVLQALVQQAADMLLSGHAGGDFLIGPGKELGGHHDLIPPGKVPQRPAQVLLAGTALIADGGVEEVDPQLQPPPDDLSGMRLVDGLGMLPVVCIAKAHAPHADTGYL